MKYQVPFYLLQMVLQLKVWKIQKYYTHNIGVQNIFEKIEKSIKIGQDQKTLMFVFVLFF